MGRAAKAVIALSQSKPVDHCACFVQAAWMDCVTVTELEGLARAAAEEVAGIGAVEAVDVRSGIVFDDEPVYYFSFLIDQQKAKARLGAIMIGLGLKLGDDLDARGDSHFPLIRLFNREDWDKRVDAGSI